MGQSIFSHIYSYNGDIYVVNKFNDLNPTESDADDDDVSGEYGALDLRGVVRVARIAVRAARREDDVGGGAYQTLVGRHRVRHVDARPVVAKQLDDVVSHRTDDLTTNFPEQFTARAQEPLFPTSLSFTT